MIVFPCAKINLGLAIGPVRPDGYHEVLTAMVPVSWTDILELTPAREGWRLSVTGRSVACEPEQNLVMRAARAYAEAFPEARPQDIHLHKVIPDGAGLGGGSADAAFTLAALDAIHGNPLGPDKLRELAARLGADCPFFVEPRPMLCTGTGTSLSPLAVGVLRPGMPILIAKPPRSVTTKQAYAAARSRESLPSELRLERWADVPDNDFEASVFPLLPEVAAMKGRLAEAGALHAALSGSGSAVYGIFPEGMVEEGLMALVPEGWAAKVAYPIL